MRPPTQAEVDAGGKYLFINANAGRGKIFDADSKVLWEYKPPPSPWNIFNGLTRGPDFVLTDGAEQEILRIARDKTFPLPEFTLTGAGCAAARIRKRSRFFFDYAVEIEGKPRWELRIRPFTVDIYAKSAAGGHAWIIMQSALIWQVLIEAGHDCRELVAVLAFLHSERSRS
jgi:hypothetical protein